MKIGERIAQYRKARGLTQQQLAQELGTVKQTIGNYERGDREPSMAVVARIAEILGVSRGALYGVQDADEAASDGERLTNHMLLNGDTAASLALALGVSIESVQRMCASDLDPTPEQRRFLADRYGVPAERLFQDDAKPATAADQRPLPADVRLISDLHVQRVPMIGEVAAGKPIYAPEDWPVYVDAPVKCDAAITIRGDSMAPKYLPGDVVYIKCTPDVPEGAVAVVFLDNDATIKHVYRRPTGLTLISDNPDYPPLMPDFMDYDNKITIFGVPVGFTRMYKADPLSKIRKGFK